MHEMQTIVTDDRGVCPSVCLSRMHRMTPHSETDLRSASLCGVIQCILCQSTLASCLCAIKSWLVWERNRDLSFYCFLSVYLASAADWWGDSRSFGSSKQTADRKPTEGGHPRGSQHWSHHQHTVRIISILMTKTTLTLHCHELIAL